jgi:quinol monooxygenase YgiN
MQPLTVIATISAKAGHESLVREQLRSLLVPTRAEPGCLRYELSEGEGEFSWVMVERWSSEATWNTHMESQHLGRFKAIMPEAVERFELFVGVELN